MSEDFIYFAITCITGVGVFITYVCYEQYKYTKAHKHWLKHRYDK